MTADDPVPSTESALTYGRYLQIEALLELQRPRSEEHDEILFIIIHQVYELWFKELLHELDRACALLEAADAPRAQHTLKRVLTILKVMVSQLDILETMTPLEFLTFRQRLEAASGFQSDQFRQLEFLLGLKSKRAIARFPEGSRAHQALVRRFEARTLWDAFLTHLSLAGYGVPAAHLHRDVTAPIESSPELQAVLLEVYRGHPANSELCERLVDLDEGFQEWRYRHVKMVERTIGTKMGTGGSSGAEYLKSTVGRPAFPDLWDIRARM